ncbi:tRNA pseudouridine(55) synthase TruB [Sphingomonas oryzagri]|uniref:tRNA pseudouridine synthase B n=1 Tax=Sphingomonas oryzagri TaxID=3042314 RepID=A0ABT6N3X3_9SPHN|nr:tRNA pseudouridine(55) synthase TruB [Sphingomonas oryzagri]MDH7639761.1 tRNA pseudouridine(55) synthase TruB [Sphingomonas oryzagri]
MTQDKTALHGWLIIDKPVGPGSTDIVSKAKRALRDGGYAKVKVGHGGTLDPLASGVLPIALGEATKLSGRMLDADKAYAFTVKFGEQTDTLDLEGKVIATSEVRPTLAELEAMLPRFTGPIEQVPPAYSALKVDGQRAYDLARAGEEVALASRNVTVHSLAIQEEDPHPTLSREGGRGQSSPSPAFAGECRDEGLLLSEATLLAAVSKGTYIRSLARDIAIALGTVGHVTMLRRIKSGPFTLDQAISLDSLAELAKARTLEQALLPLKAGLDDIPALALTPDQAGALRQGRPVIGIAKTPGLYFATAQSVPVALVQSDGIEVKVVRGFNL